jgi:benzylsuccinate CoA-transferase BbsF subunit
MLTDAPAHAPLAGIRVIEICIGAAGPTAAKCLGEYGAEIVRIESRARPDMHRGGFDESRWNKTPSFAKLHRNKKSITLDLRSESGRAVALDLIRQSDVLVENFSLGVLERWGFDYDSLKNINLGIIVLRLKGMGLTGPRSRDVAWGPNLCALFGQTYLWNHPDSGVPTGEARTQHPDFMSGVAGAAAVVAALIQRQRTGRGQMIDEAETEVAAWLLGPTYLEYLINGKSPAPAGNLRSDAAPCGVYRCAGEDKWCVINVETDEQWTWLCRALGEPEWCRGRDLATADGRLSNRGRIDEHLAAWTATRSSREVFETLQRNGVPAAPIQDVQEQLADPHFGARGSFTTLTEPEMGSVTTETPPTRTTLGYPRIVERAPLMGEHTDQVLHSVLGLSNDQIEDLRRAGALF